LIMFILLKTFSGASRHNASQKTFKIQATMQYHPIMEWKKKIIFAPTYTIVITMNV